MKIVKASATIEGVMPENPLAHIERAGRTCYKSEPKDYSLDATCRFVRMLIERGHHSVLEHASMTARFVVDRGVSHELVRHRLCAFSQESTRFCNYSKDKFGNEVTFIALCFWHEESHEYSCWDYVMREAEHRYLELLDLGAKPEEARSVLPNSLKTEIVVTANFREWRYIFALRTSEKAHPQMREVMIPLLADARKRILIVFDDVGEQN